MKRSFHCSARGSPPRARNPAASYNGFAATADSVTLNCNWSTDYVIRRRGRERERFGLKRLPSEGDEKTCVFNANRSDVQLHVLSWPKRLIGRRTAVYLGASCEPRCIGFSGARVPSK